MDHAPRIIRSMTFVAAHDEDAILDAAACGLDAVGLDFEDLTPRDAKAGARERFAAIAAELVRRGVVVMARANPLGAGGEADVEAVVGESLHCLNTPKAESAEQVVAFAGLLDRAEATVGVAPGRTLVRPVIETAAGIRFAYEIASASPRVTYAGGVTGLRWGDLGATVGLIESHDGRESHYLRSKVLIDVRAAGVRFPIGGGATARRDREGIRSFAVENKHLGYTGAYCAPDPEVVAVINDVFTPTRREVAEWRDLLPVLEQARADGLVAYRAEGRVMDTAAIGWMREQLDLARRLGMLDAAVEPGSGSVPEGS